MFSFLWRETNHLQPLNILTCLLNRNYVRPELKRQHLMLQNKWTTNSRGRLQTIWTLTFLSLTSFLLFLTLATMTVKNLTFLFVIVTTRQANLQMNVHRLWLRYLRRGTTWWRKHRWFCVGKGFWQYTFMTKVIAQDNKQDFTFDIEKTRELVNLFFDTAGYWKNIYWAAFKDTSKLDFGQNQVSRLPSG